MPYLDEAQVEINCIDWLRSIGYDYVYGPEIAPGGERAERDTLLPKLLNGEINM